MKADSPGKINLFLDVTAKRENGYHEILTVFLPIHDLKDTIEVVDHSELIINSDHPCVPCDERNLVHKAAILFSKATGLDSKWQICIQKKLPVAGGMGGGSSNAATTLKLLNEKYSNPLTYAKLAELALSIGADVPYFLNPVPSLAQGIGEKIETLSETHKVPLLLVTFDFPISAAWSYQNRLKGFHSSKLTADTLIKLWHESDLQLEKFIYNDLAYAPRAKFPILELTISDLNNFGGIAEVSGSGPTVFGTFRTEEDRDQCHDELIKKGYPQNNLFKATAG